MLKLEMLAPVDLDVPAMRRVVEKEGGCIVWGGAVRLSPADDVLIRVERPLDFDAGAARIVTTNTIAHETNAIDVSPLVARGVESVHKEIRNAIRIR